MECLTLTPCLAKVVVTQACSLWRGPCPTAPPDWVPLLMGLVGATGGWLLGFVGLGMGRGR